MHLAQFSHVRDGVTAGGGGADAGPAADANSLQSAKWRKKKEKKNNILSK